MTKEPCRVLVVDDEQSVAATVSRRLRSAGYDVVATSDGDEALARVAETHPHLILLDRRLGAWDGLKLLAALKSGDRTQSIPVVMMSGCNSDEKEALASGAAGFLEKPFGGRQLVELVDSLAL